MLPSLLRQSLLLQGSCSVQRYGCAPLPRASPATCTPAKTCTLRPAAQKAGCSTIGCRPSQQLESIRICMQLRVSTAAQGVHTSTRCCRVRNCSNSIDRNACPSSQAGGTLSKQQVPRMDYSCNKHGLTVFKLREMDRQKPTGLLWTVSTMQRERLQQTSGTSFSASRARQEYKRQNKPKILLSFFRRIFRCQAFVGMGLGYY